jgi:hypothetical protein
MGIPQVQLLGSIYLPGGDLVVAGEISLRLYPPGVIVPDTALAVQYKIGGLTKASISSTAIPSLVVLSTQSMSHANAFYLTHISVNSPVTIDWEELWQINTTNNTLSIASVTLLSNTPVL